MHANWIPWLYTSVAKYFQDRKGSYAVILQGDRWQTDELRRWCEVRIVGPRINQLCNNCHVIDCTVNLLVVSVFDDNNLILDQTMSGYFVSQFGPINVYQYGDKTVDPSNDGSRLGCMRLVSDVRVTSYGQVDFEKRYNQTVIDADYRLEI